MQLHSHLLNLEYDPAHDVLTVEWPTMDRALASVLKNAMEHIVDTLRHYDIGSLLPAG